MRSTRSRGGAHSDAVALPIGTRPLLLTTPDGVLLSALHLPGPPGVAAPLGVVLAPGFSGSSSKPAVRRIADRLARVAGVLLVDLRGHGSSDGLSTLGDREALDLEAAVSMMRRLGYAKVVTIGWSMGGSCVLRHAALVGSEVHGWPLRSSVDAVVSVSAASRWHYKGTPAMRRLHWLVETAPGRWASRRLLKVRVDPDGWTVLPIAPAEAAQRLTVPLLVVHGTRDAYFPVEHAEAIADAAPASALWLIEGFGHAEEAAGPELVDAIARALPRLAAGELPASEWA